MAELSETTPRIASARPEMTRAVMVETGLDDAMLTELVHRFYGKIRADETLGPIFADRITDLAVDHELIRAKHEVLHPIRCVVSVRSRVPR